MQVTDPEDGRRIVEWVKPRGQVIRGPRAQSVPDLLFRLRPGYGVSRSVFGALFSHSPTHRRFSGGHTPEGVIAVGPELRASVPAALEDVYGAILGSLEEACSESRV